MNAIETLKALDAAAAPPANGAALLPDLSAAVLADIRRRDMPAGEWRIWRFAACGGALAAGLALAAMPLLGFTPGRLMTDLETSALVAMGSAELPF